MGHGYLAGVMALAAAAVVAAPATKPPAKAPAAKAPAAPSLTVKKPSTKPAKAPPAPPAVMAFNPTELDLAPGETYRVELLVPSPTRKAVTGALQFEPIKGLTPKPDARWSGKVPPWGTKTYPSVTAAPDASGDLPLVATFDKGGTARMMVHVARPRLEIIPGFRKLTVKVTSPFKTRPLTGRIVASNPDRFLENITTREFKVAPGQTEEVVFPLPGAAPAESETYNFTLTVETYQGYRDQKTHALSFPPHT
jgi:uncharacterized cupredoxin-like copper-binding protein